MEAVKSWPIHLSPIDIRIFLGLFGYYRRLVEGFSSMASSLTASTQKKANFVWSETCEKNFQLLKDMLTPVILLALLEGMERFMIYCEASRVGFGCVSCNIVR